MKISIKIEYKEKVYTSDYIEYSENEIQDLKAIITRICKGEAGYFIITKMNQEYYFGSEILKDSILTITTDKPL